MLKGGAFCARTCSTRDLSLVRFMTSYSTRFYRLEDVGIGEYGRGLALEFVGRLVGVERQREAAEFERDP
jgi:hypothetical protein